MIKIFNKSTNSMSSYNRKKGAKESSETHLGQLDGVVVGSGGPVSTVDFKKDFEEAAKRLKELVKIGDTPVRKLDPKNNMKADTTGEIESEEKPKKLANKLYKSSKESFAGEASLTELETINKISKQIGLKTAADLKRLMDEYPGKTPLQALREHRKTLGKDFKIAEEAAAQEFLSDGIEYRGKKVLKRKTKDGTIRKLISATSKEDGKPYYFVTYDEYDDIDAGPMETLKEAEEWFSVFESLNEVGDSDSVITKQALTKALATTGDEIEEYADKFIIHSPNIDGYHEFSVRERLIREKFGRVKISFDEGKNRIIVLKDSSAFEGANTKEDVVRYPNKYIGGTNKVNNKASTEAIKVGQIFAKKGATNREGGSPIFQVTAINNGTVSLVESDTMRELDVSLARFEQDYYVLDGGKVYSDEGEYAPKSDLFSKSSKESIDDYAQYVQAATRGLDALKAKRFGEALHKFELLTKWLKEDLNQR